MFVNLVVEKWKKLKCNAKVILGAENVIDKVFRDVAQFIEVEQLIVVKGKETIYFHLLSNIYMLAFIANEKLLFSSHTVYSISLYGDCNLWLDLNETDSEGFKVFCGSAFDCVVEI